MVRPSPSSVTTRLRNEPHVRGRIASVLSELVARRSPHGVDISLPPLARAKAAEAVTLLVSDSPSNRHEIGATVGVHAALIELVNKAWRDAAAYDADVATAVSVEKYEAAEASAEAIWILAFNSPANHASLISRGAIEALCGMVTARDVLGVATPARAAMWALAALQNLAASYCDTRDGRCTWRWEYGERLDLVDGSRRLTVDAEAARLRISAFPGLVAAAVKYGCEGPVPPEDDGVPGGVPWPSKATAASRDAPSVVPWAAAGLLKNLALSPGAAEALLLSDTGPEALACLCKLAASRDWLEKSKAEAALYYLQPKAAGRDNEQGGNGCAGVQAQARVDARGAVARGKVSV